MLDMPRNRPVPSFEEPPEWLAALPGFDLFRVEADERNLRAFPEGVDETTQFPGGTWRVTMIMPVDLTIAEGSIDPLVLLVTVANGAAKVDDKLRSSSPSAGSTASRGPRSDRRSA